MSNDIKESSKYDNFLGKTERVANPISELFSENPEEDNVENVKEWEKHWKGMPEYSNDNNPPYKMINIRFRTKEDYEDFCRIIGQKLTDSTKSIWHPALDKTGNKFLGWLEEPSE